MRDRIVLVQNVPKFTYMHLDIKIRFQ